MNRRDHFQKAKNYVLYYGAGKVNKMTDYDIAIVEPLGQTVNDVEHLKRFNTLVIAYISIMEVSPDNPVFQLLQEEDFLTINGEKIKKEAFETYLLDLQSKRWQGILHHQIGKIIHHSGYDGIFMDTIGDVEGHDLPYPLQQEQMKHAVHLVSSLRRLFPEHILIQNNGLEQLCLQTADYLDGICWENPPFGRKTSETWTAKIVKRLSMLRSKYGIRSFILVDEDVNHRYPIANITARTVADREGFLFYKTRGQYLTIEPKEAT